MTEKIALLIDCDNISCNTIEDILKDIAKKGDIIIKRAYGNWSSNTLKNWPHKLNNLGIRAIQQTDHSKGQNATDIGIVIDAMDILYSKKINSMALVSADTDFIPLIVKLKEECIKTYGYGYKKTPQSLRVCYDSFSTVESRNNKFKQELK